MKVLSCGAGQQSTALALMSCDNVVHPGKFPLVPVYDAILFCDLGGEREWVSYQVEFIKDYRENSLFYNREMNRFFNCHF